MTVAQKQILAILFAGGDPVELSRLSQALEMGEQMVLEHVDALRAQMAKMGLPFELLRLGDKLQLCTQAEYADPIRRTLELRRNAPLSQAALEVLAVIAYNQPVTRSFIERVRGVDSAGVTNSLIEKGLIEEAGRMELPGRPIAYRTTANFLRCFGLESLDRLPALPGAEEAPDELLLEGQVDFQQVLAGRSTADC